MMFLFAYAITLDVRNIRLAVLDEDGSVESREYTASVIRSGYFRLHTAVKRLADVERLLDRGDVRVVLIIPAGFARSLGQGLPADVQTLVDGSLANTAIVALNYLNAISEAHSRRLQERALAARVGLLPRLSPAIRVSPNILR